MVRIFCIASLALSVVTAVSGHVIRHKRAPPGWETNVLESYDVYHSRYIQWGCENKHNTTFWAKCCHPLLNGESLDALTKDPNRNCSAALANPPLPPSSHPAVTPLSSPKTSSAGPESSSPPGQPAFIKPFQPPQPPIKQLPTETSTTTSTKETPPPSPSPSPPPSPSPSPSSSPSAPHTGNGMVTGGKATWFTQGGNAGACGVVHSDSDMIAAIDAARYGPTNVQSPLCGRKVQIFTADYSKSVTVTIEDACPTCDNANSIDLSTAAFQQLAPLGVGLLDIVWQFV